MKSRTYALFFAVTVLFLFFSSCKKDNIAGNGNTKPDLDIPETLPPVQTAVSTTVNANCLGFYKALPARYDSTSKKYPLMVFIHGIGELGNGTTDLPKV